MSSYLQNLDVRPKIAAALVLSFFCAFADSFAVPAAVSFYSLVLLSLSGFSPAKALKKIFPGLFFVLFLLLTLPFSTTGDVVRTIGPLEITRQGLLLAALLSLKAFAALLAMLAMLGTASLAEIAHGLHHFHCPLKMVNIFFMSFRYFKTLEREAGRMSAALKARGFTAGANMRTIKTYADFIGMLLIRSLDRAERVRKAMLCRGFKDHIWLMSHFSFKKADLAFCAHFTLLTLLLIRI